MLLSTGEWLYIGIFVFYAIVFSYLFTFSVSRKLKYFKYDTERSFKELEERLERYIKDYK